VTSLIVLLAAAFVFPALLFIPAPYGRHARAGFGPMMNAKLGWVVMEAFSLGAFAYGLLTANPFLDQPTVWFLASLWALHYGNRTFVFPLRMRGEGKQQPVMTVAMAIAFNCLNGWGNSTALAPRTVDFKVALGVALFFTGFAVNVHSDAVLRALRKPGDSGYAIPTGGLYRWISCPNYFGELIEWTGFAIAAWTLPALAFAVFTAANLVPRAIAHHRWYLAKFPDYPKERKPIFPFVG
jgi:protein-S-isoprenylcysteine O-methyltransferase Ste14